MKLIEVENVTKEYKMVNRKEGIRGAINNIFTPSYTKVKAVDDISFTVERGAIAGFIGPNGAGKSTTIKMMVGVLAPTQGNIRIGGLDPFKDRKKNARNLGIVFGQRTQLWWDIPIKETYKLLKKMYCIDDADFNQRMEMFSEILEIEDFLKKPTRQLSLGQRVRADLCAALLHNPQVLFLDEPTIGLDVVVKERIHKFLLEINKSYQTTIILTTHDISDIEKLCDAITVIDHGHTIYDGNLADLKLKYGGEQKIIFNATSEDIKTMKEIFKDYAIGINEEENVSLLFSKKQYEITDILKLLMSNCKVKNLNLEETSLESVIKKIYIKSSKEA